MGTITGPGVSWWDTFNTILDPSSLFSYSGSGFTFNNPLRYKGWSDWTMTNNTNLVAGSGISKYVKQITKQQFSQILKFIIEHCRLLKSSKIIMQLKKGMDINGTLFQS